jgi:hypothetical protein
MDNANVIMTEDTPHKEKDERLFPFRNQALNGGKISF